MFAAVLDNIFEKGFGLVAVLGEDIERLHIDFGKQPLCRPFGSAELVLGMSFEQLNRLVAVVNHKLPRVAHRLTAEFQALDIGDDAVNLRESESVGVHLEEYLCVPVRQGTVEIALPKVIVEGGVLVFFAVVLAVELDALKTRGRQFHPLAEVGVGGGQIARVDAGIVVLREGALVVGAVEVGGVVVEPYAHREPVESVGANGMVLRIRRCDQLIHLLHSGREIGGTQRLRVGYIEEILATAERDGCYEKDCYGLLFHNTMGLYS